MALDSNVGIKGLIMQLQHFSVNDGDGIRTVIFMAGCPLRCKWCCNPESWSLEINEYVDEMSIPEIIDEVDRQIIFYRYSNGGITYSGGEPTYQLNFLENMVDIFYNRGIHQSIETSGYFIWEDVYGVFEKMDFIFVDIKHFNSRRHKQLTGVHNHSILDNIRAMGRLGKDIVIRIPLIKDINDDEGNIADTAEFVYRNIPNGKIELLPYHSLGNYKYKSLGLDEYEYSFQTPDEEDIQRVKEIINSYDVQTIEYR